MQTAHTSWRGRGALLSRGGRRESAASVLWERQWYRDVRVCLCASLHVMWPWIYLYFVCVSSTCCNSCVVLLEYTLWLYLCVLFYCLSLPRGVDRLCLAVWVRNTSVPRCWRKLWKLPYLQVSEFGFSNKLFFTHLLFDELIINYSTLYLVN